jgi:serine/threonine-protein kinase RsbT
MANAELSVQPIRMADDVVRVRQLVRERAILQGFSLVDQTKIVTAASELARNTLEHGGGGQVQFELLINGTRRGLRLVFSDRGPGIENIEQALRDGFTTGGGLGLGLGGAKRLSNEFEIDSKPGAGTRVTITRWR